MCKPGLNGITLFNNKIRFHGPHHIIFFLRFGGGANQTSRNEAELSQNQKSDVVSDFNFSKFLKFGVKVKFGVRAKFLGNKISFIRNNLKFLN